MERKLKRDETEAGRERFAWEEENRTLGSSAGFFLDTDRIEFDIITDMDIYSKEFEDSKQAYWDKEEEKMNHISQDKEGEKEEEKKMEMLPDKDIVVVVADADVETRNEEERRKETEKVRRKETEKVRGKETEKERGKETEKERGRRSKREKGLEKEQAKAISPKLRFTRSHESRKQELRESSLALSSSSHSLALSSSSSDSTAKTSFDESLTTKLRVFPGTSVYVNIKTWYVAGQCPFTDMRPTGNQNEHSIFLGVSIYCCY